MLFRPLLRVVIALGMLVSPAAHALSIDEFEVEAVPPATPTPIRLQSSTIKDIDSKQFIVSSRAVGGDRQLLVRKTTNEKFGIASLAVGGGGLAFAQEMNGGFGSITWDGDRSESSLKADGLGSVDLAQDGGNAFIVQLKSFDYPFDNAMRLALRLYDARDPSGARYSEVVVTVDRSWGPPSAPFPLSIPFSLFSGESRGPVVGPGGSLFATTSTRLGGGADIRRIGAIQLSFEGFAGDMEIGPLRTNGRCNSVPTAIGKVVDACNVCLESPDANAGKDRCGVCFKGPSGYDYSAQKVFDGCGLCPSQPGYTPGQGSRDACGVCLKGDPNYVYKDIRDTCGRCPTEPNFNQPPDACGVCNGKAACLDCKGVPFGTAKVDPCSVCGGDGTSCLDCRGVPNGASKVDACGICGGSVTNSANCNTAIQSCVMVKATDEVKEFQRTLIRKAQEIRTKYIDERTRSTNAKCGIDTTKTDAAVVAAYKTILASSKEIFTKGVEVCGDSCVTVSYAEDVERLLPQFKIIQNHALSLARKVQVCYAKRNIPRAPGGQRGVANTINSVNTGLTTLIENCRDRKVCPPKK